MPPAKLTTVFLADDHKVIRDGLSILLKLSGDFEVVGEAADGRALVDGVLALAPHVVVTDLTMPALGGADAVEQLREAGYPGAIIVLSMHDDRQSVSRALKSGANAYVHKDHAFQEVVIAVRAALNRETYLSPLLAQLMQTGTVPTVADLLSMREREVFQLLAEGRNVKEAAGALSLSPKTVETHRANIYAKLGVSNAVELSLLAVREGFVKP